MRLLRWLALVSIVGAPILMYFTTPREGGGSWWGAWRRAVPEQTAAGERESVEEHRSGAPRAAGGQDDDDDLNVPSRRVKVDGLNGIRLSRQEQEQTGVALQTLKRRTYLSESLAVGRVLDIQPLLDLRASYNAALGEQEVHRAAIAASGRSVRRRRQLHQEGANVSMRQLQEAESQAASDRARLTAAERRLQDIRSQALLQWGETLVDMALSGDSHRFNDLVLHREALVLVTLRRGEVLPEDTGFIHVGPTGDRTRARRAYLVSPAARTDPLSQGETYFFRTDARTLRVGMRMDAWIPRSGQPREGVEVPGTAVIWHANKLWVYAKADEGLFVRRPLHDYEETREGWFVTEGVAAGDAVVVSGAQMLFSEEFRSSIPSEDAARE